MKPQVLCRAVEVEEALAELGLSAQPLREAVLTGELERLSCSSFDPPTYPGTAAWSLGVRSLRELLRPRGYMPLNDRNLPMVVHPARRVGIVLSSGTESTGDPENRPTTKYPKGPVLAGQVEVNRSQLLLFAEERFVPVPHKSEIVTWLLLVRPTARFGAANAHESVVRCELSLPAAIDEDGYVVRWASRLILEPVRLDERPGKRSTAAEDQEFEIAVSRRS